MSTRPIKSIEDSFLKKFLIGRGMPRLKDPQEKNVFRDLQRFDLIRVGPAGKFRITALGKYALGVGVKRYLTNARLEKKLLMEYVKSKSYNRWLAISGLLILLTALTGVTFFSEEIVQLLDQ